MKHYPKKNRKDRKEAFWVSDLDGLHGIFPYIMPKRTESEVYLNEKIDVTELLKYIEKRKQENPDFKLTPFHAFVTAIGKTIYFRPKLNRFVQGRRYYQRYDITESFVVKRTFSDTSEEMLMILNTKPDMNINSIAHKIIGDTTELRKEGTNDIGDLMNVVTKFPRPIISFIVGMAKWLDYHGICPDFLTDGDTNFTTVLISNLGSIKCNAPYHHLNNYGTNSILITIGVIHKEQVVNKDGEIEIRDVCDFGCTIDERIADGFYFARSVNFIKHLVAHPELLELEIQEEVPFEY